MTKLETKIIGMNTIENYLELILLKNDLDKDLNKTKERYKRFIELQEKFKNA